MSKQIENKTMIEAVEDTLTEEIEIKQITEEVEDKQIIQEWKSKKTFKELGLNPWLIEALNRMNISYPTEIQEHCIPEILKGRDVIGGAKTGSGKTAAFALPMLNKLGMEPYGVFGLILTPTRELALQIAEQFAALGESMQLKYTVLVGGLDMLTQAMELKRRPHIIIATPGRLADVIQSSPDVVHLNRLNSLVLDEADRLLTTTFAKDLKIIFDVLPKSKQTLLFTATITDPVKNLLNKQHEDKPKPFEYIIQSDILTVETLDQRYIFLPGYVKEAYLYHILNLEKDQSMIIFVNRCYTCELYKILLNKLEIPCVALHSGMKQHDRISAIARFKADQVKILISTDVGSRGLDIPMVQMVINLDLPRDPIDYIHRVGRTARAGRGGKALSLVSERDVDIVHAIEQKINNKMQLYDINENDVVELLNKVSEAKRFASMYLLDNDFDAVKRKRKDKMEKSNKKGK